MIAGRQSSGRQRLLSVSNTAAASSVLRRWQRFANRLDARGPGYAVSLTGGNYDAFMAQRIQTLSSMTSTAAKRPEPSASHLTALNTRSTSAPRTAENSATPWSSTSGTPGGPARPGVLPGPSAETAPSTPPRSASGPRNKASKSRTAAGSRPQLSRSTRPSQAHKPPCRRCGRRRQFRPVRDPFLYHLTECQPAVDRVTLSKLAEDDGQHLMLGVIYREHRFQGGVIGGEHGVFAGFGLRGAGVRRQRVRVGCRPALPVTFW